MDIRYVAQCLRDRGFMSDDRGMRDDQPMTGNVDFDQLLREILAGRVDAEIGLENYFRDRKAALLRKCSDIMMAILAENHEQICAETRELFETVRIQIPEHLMYAPIDQLRAACKLSEYYMREVIKDRLNQRIQPLLAQAQQRVDLLIKEEEEEVIRLHHAISKIRE
ncbi:hypothetical protein LINGRAHAP2_LOCUS21651 [Linum grandiflorum]